MITSIPPALLDYFFSTNPNPIQISTPQSSTTGQVNISVSSTTDVYCNEIVLAIPAGTDTTSLYETTATGSVNTSGWALATTEKVDGASLGLMPGITYVKLTYQCLSSTQYLINYNLVFGVVGVINQTQGVCTVYILETSGTTNDPATFTQKQASVTLNKENPQFYLQNLVAVVPTAPTVPVAEFTNGSPILFEWESNGTYFQIFAKGQTTPIYSGTAPTFTLQSGISCDTTFFLAASVSGNQSVIPANGFEPIFLYDSITVTVSNPDITPNSVQVAGTLEVTGVTTLGSVTASSAQVTGLLNAQTVAATGAATVGSLSTTGEISAAELALTGTLSATGQTTLAGLALTGLLSTTGQIGIVGTPQYLGNSNGSFTAPSDGFVFGTVGHPSDATQVSVAWLSIWNNAYIVNATGGNTCTMFRSGGSSYQFWTGSNNQTCSMPVSNGMAVGYGVQYADNNEVNPPIWFYWVPLGAGSVAMAEPQEAGAVPMPAGFAPPRMVTTASETTSAQLEKIDVLVGIVSKLFGNSPTPNDITEFRDALTALVFEEGRITRTE